MNLVVAIPVKNEAERIEGCLRAFATQVGLDGHALPPFEVLLYINNSDDETAAIATALTPSLGFPLQVICTTLAPGEASAGGARRRAMSMAADRLDARRGGGVLMTTDADSRVAPDWIARTLAAIAAGADAVAGTIVLDAEEEAALPARLKGRGALEARYEALVCELETWLDPQDGDPWPRHPTESGASLAVTLESFRAVGGVPNKPLGEDRALVAALRHAGFRIRHAPEVKVVTSGRLFGRAAGGCADTMRLRIEQPDALCDAYLRPVWDILRDPGRRTGRITSALSPDALPRHIALARALLAGLKLNAGLGQAADTVGRQGRDAALGLLKGVHAPLPIDAPDTETPASR